MGIVSWIVGSVEGYLATAGETAFGALLGAVGTIGMAMATLAVVFVALNAMLQVKSIDLRTAVMLGVKLALVGIFARNWAEFNSVTNAIVGGSEHLAGVIVGAAGGLGDGSAGHFAQQFDAIISDLIDTANNIGSAMNWVGGAFFHDNRLHHPCRHGRGGWPDDRFRQADDHLLCQHRTDHDHHVPPERHERLFPELAHRDHQLCLLPDRDCCRLLGHHLDERPDGQQCEFRRSRDPRSGHPLLCHDHHGFFSRYS